MFSPYQLHPKTRSKFDLPTPPFRKIFAYRLRTCKLLRFLLPMTFQSTGSGNGERRRDFDKILLVIVFPSYLHKNQSRFKLILGRRSRYTKLGELRSPESATATAAKIL